MKIDNIMTKSILILGCAMALIACESSATDAETGTPDPDTNEENNGNNNNNNNETEEVGNMLPTGYDLENCDGFAFDPCGGDIVGTWAATGVCMAGPEGESMGSPGDFADPSCPAQQTGVRVIMTGTTLNFNADNTYNHALNFGMELAVWRPSACDQGVSCDLLQDALNEEWNQGSNESTEEAPDSTPPSKGTEPDSGESDEEGDEGEDEEGDMSMAWACSSKDDGCLCIAVGSEPTEQESGTYDTANNMVTMVADAGDEGDEGDDGPPVFKYCVDGTTLQFEAPMSPDEPEQMFITFDKQ